MTVNSITNRVAYAGNGTANPLPVSFPFQMQGDLVVISTVIATGAQTTLVLNSDYSITGATDGNGFYPNGGNVVPSAAVPITNTWTIYRDPQKTQLVEHVDNDPLPAASIDNPLDKLTMIVQRLSDRLDHALGTPDGDPVLSLLFPSAPNRAGRVPAFDSTGAATLMGSSSAQVDALVEANALVPVLSGSTLALPNTAALLTLFSSAIVLPSGSAFITAGRDAAGDGGGALFYYDAADTTTADNGGTVRVDGQNRRFKIAGYTELNALLFSGADIGAKINAAYAALPARGGTIVVPPGRYDYGTPIVFGTIGKYALLKGAGPGGADATSGSCLNYTPVTATAAIKLDYGQPLIGPPGPTNGLSGITLINNGITTTGGGGSLATGILVGTSNGGDFDATYDRVMVQGFGVGYSNLNNNAVTQVWNAPVFLNNTACLAIAGATMKFIGGQMAANGRVFLQPAGVHQCELYFIGTTFFDNTHDPVFDCNTSTTKADLNFTDCHLENSPSLHAHYIGGATNVTMLGGLMEDDNATGTGDWMIQTGNFSIVTILGTKFASARAQTCIVDMTNEVRTLLQPIILSPSAITAFAAGAFAAEATMLPTVPYGNTPQTWQVRAAMGIGGAFYPSVPGGAQQTAASLYANTGAPNNSNGANGDFYFRSDGGSLTSVYQKRAGTWTGIV